MCVLRGAKGLLLLALAQEGVTIDPNTLAASIHLVTTGKHPNTGSSSSGTGVGYSSSNLSVPSPRIFRKAEAVRCLLQEELSDLLRDIIVPVSQSLIPVFSTVAVCVCVSACVLLNSTPYTSAAPIIFNSFYLTLIYDSSIYSTFHKSRCPFLLYVGR